MSTGESQSRMLQILERNSKAASDPWRMAQIEKIRAAMGPEMCSVADALRETFGAKITWVETPTLSMGTKPEEHSRD